MESLLKTLAFEKKEEEYKHQAKECTVTEAAAIMSNAKKIAILTGSGLSVASGIPSYSGEDLKFWESRNKYGEVTNPKEIQMNQFFRKDA